VDEGKAELAAFEARWQDERLVMDKWFALQVAHARPEAAVALAERLTLHPLFEPRNPNRLRSVLGSLAANAAGFHDPSGAGYRFMAAWLGRIDGFNPLMAARTSGAFETWRRLDPARRALVEAELRRSPRHAGPVARPSRDGVTDAGVRATIRRSGARGLPTRAHRHTCSPHHRARRPLRGEAMRERIDPLIEERAPWLASRRPLVRALARPVRAVLDRVLQYPRTVALGESLDHLPVAPLMDELARLLCRDVSASGLHNVPRHGPALVVANHPTGIADGIVLWHVLSRVRPDLYIYTNRDILRVMPQFADLIIPVEWRTERRTHAKARETMALTKAAVDEGRLGVIFPSGRLAKR
jgi:hypothetical protein